jgi:oligopeptidase A
LIGGEKSAGKFSTIWSKMLAADAFSAIEEVPNYESENILDNPNVKAITKKFRSTFLATGSSRPSAETFRNFRGRDPSHEALLVSLGLKKFNQPHIRSQSAAGDDE